MTDSAVLERSYRKVLALYPRSFRKDNEDEILAVLMETAEEGQTRIGLAEAADLIRGAMRMRLWPVAPRPGTVRAAVRLMLAGALAELATLVTVVLTAGQVKAGVLAKDPAAWHGAMVHITLDEICLPIAIGLWLWLAWANGRGQDWARLVSLSSFSLTSLGLLYVLSQDAQAVALADVIAAAVVWAIGLASVVLIFTPASGRYYRPAVAPAQQ
jgi:hypothetical protein